MMMLWIRSIDVLGHHCVEIFKTYLAIFVAVCFLQHQSQGFGIQVLLDMVVHVFKVIKSEIIFVISIVFFED